MSDADDLADLLAELTVSLVVELHPAIADLVMPGHFRPAGAPAAAVFLRPLEGEPYWGSGVEHGILSFGKQHQRRCIAQREKAG